MEASWVHPVGATFLVSIIPINVLIAIPSVIKGNALPLSVMMYFAAGSLLTDALFHLAEDAKEQNPASVALHCLMGIFLFFAIDKATRFHQDSHGATGYLSLIADAVHNFTDGMAISASYAKGTKSGLATTLAIFMHEIPHELGDYALLAKSGFSHAKIIQSQFFTAAAAFAGTAFGLIVGSEQEKGHEWLLPITCGGFLYLALCSILAEAVQDSQRRSNWKCVVTDILAFATGMAIIAGLELLG